MTNTNNISKIKHSTGILFGLLAAVVILVSQGFYFDYVGKIEGKVKTEKTSDADEDSHESVIKMSQQALSSGVEISIQSVLHFIGEIYTDDSVEVPSVSQNFKGLTSYFQTLFRLIISPNAP